MPTDEATLARERQANARYAADYERRLAAEIVAMLPDREEAKRVLASVDAVLPIQIWVPDARAPGFAEELARQCRAEAALSVSPQGRAEAEFWNEVAVEAWASIDASARSIDTRRG